jgi:hypothetical protein
MEAEEEEEEEEVEPEPQDEQTATAWTKKARIPAPSSPVRTSPTRSSGSPSQQLLLLLHLSSTIFHTKISLNPPQTSLNPHPNSHLH